MWTISSRTIVPTDLMTSSTVVSSEIRRHLYFSSATWKKIIEISDSPVFSLVSCGLKRIIYSTDN